MGENQNYKYYGKGIVMSGAAARTGSWRKVEK